MQTQMRISGEAEGKAMSRTEQKSSQTVRFNLATELSGKHAFAGS